MGRNSIEDYLLYYSVKIFAFLLRLLPVRTALFIGRTFGRFVMYFNTKRRMIAYANLKAAFGNRCTPPELKRILRRAYENIAQGAIELLFLPKMDERYLRRYVRFENFHIAQDALKKGKGLIFLTAHFGAWEMSNVALPLKGYSYTAIARKQKPYLLNELLSRYRESKGCRIIMKGPGVKDALKTLKDNGVIGILADQNAGKNGVFVELLGRQASWNPVAMEFALKTGASLIVGFAIREKGPCIRFKLSKLIEFSPEKTKEESIKEGIKQYARAIEEMVKEHPEQWLWHHRRWKSTPVRDVIILNDSRTGHLRQSEAVAVQIGEIWQKMGYRQQDIRLKIIDIRFKKDFYANLLIPGCNFVSSFCQGCMSCLRFCLEEKSYKEIISSYADVIISCGSKTAAVNLILSKENNARSVVIMKPPLISLKKFNLAIIPRHDSPPRLKNVVITDGALNLVSKERMKGMSENLRRLTGHLRKYVIGVLVGGPIKGFSMDREFINSVLDNAIRACDEYDCDIIVTTSRRTPAGIEALIKERLKPYPRCKLLIIANENNMEGAVEGILGLSDIIVVSQESISMVSEAASSGAYILVFKQQLPRNKRHERFLKNLIQRNFIKAVGRNEVYSGIADFFKIHPKLQILDNSVKIKVALEKIL